MCVCVCKGSKREGNLLWILMHNNLQEVPDEIPTQSKDPSFFPGRKIYFLSLLMSNYKLFFFLLLSNIIYIRKQQRVKIFLGFTKIAVSLVLILQRESNFCTLGTHILPKDKMGLSITALSTVYPPELQKSWTVARTGRWTVIAINFSNFQLTSSSGYQLEKTLKKYLMGCTFAELHR